MSFVLQGVHAASITPRRATGAAIDAAAALELADFLESHGVDGITLLGSTGEFPHFPIEDRARLAQLVCRRSRVPVLVNASHSTFSGALDLAHSAADAGARGVLIMPPYYFRYRPDSLRAFFLDFAAQARVPVYLYNIPQFTSAIPPALAIDLLSTGLFAGIKDSSGDWESFDVLRRRGFSVFVGAERIYSRAAAAGAVGTISGLASAVPELMVALDRRARAGQDTAALDALTGEFLNESEAFPFPAGIREALAARGIETGPHAVPLGALGEFRAWFKEWLDRVRQVCC